MWIVMNDAFLSIVENKDDKTAVVVRARVDSDLAVAFPEFSKDIIETDNSDYRFRLFLDREYVAGKIREEVMGIDYVNFKSSVKDKWRYKAYMDIWTVMHKVQEVFTPSKWWAGYRNY